MRLDWKVGRRGEPEDLLREVEPETGRQDEDAIGRAGSQRAEGRIEPSTVGCLVFVEVDSELCGGAARLGEECRRGRGLRRVHECEQAEGRLVGQDLAIDLE